MPDENVRSDKLAALRGVVTQVQEMFGMAQI